MRALAFALVLAVPLAASAQESARVINGGARDEAALGVYAGSQSVGVSAWIDRADLNRAAYVGYVYRWVGLVSGTERYRSLYRAPNLSLFFRTGETAEVITRGGAAVGLGNDFGLGLRVGPANGAFSAVLVPTAGIEGFWVVREGLHGVSGRFPVGAELGLEAKVDRCVVFALARPLVDLWPQRAPAVRAEALAGIGITFDWPRKREAGKPAPAGP